MTNKPKAPKESFNRRFRREMLEAAKGMPRLGVMRSFKSLVDARLARDPAFREALAHEIAEGTKKSPRSAKHSRLRHELLALAGEMHVNGTMDDATYRKIADD
jgi:hypothetical protein